MSIKLETLLIRNFKRVTLAEVEFSQSGVNIIGGANGQGKSTFLHAIAYALGGAKYSPTNPHNANAGGATAVIRAKLSNGIEVERSGKSSTLKVVVDGKKGNQATLNDFLNEFALDVQTFMRASDKDKAKLLIKHMGIGDKLEALTEKEKRLFDERTIVNGDAKRKRQLADGLPRYDQAPGERVDVSELIKRERQLSAENREHEARVAKAEEIKRAGINKRAEIEELQRKLDAAKAELEVLKAQYTGTITEIEMFTPHDTSAIEEQIKNSESLNMMYEANVKAEQAELEAKAVEKEAQSLTDNINEVREQRSALMDSIQMPLPDLAINEGELVYQGQRWDCMSGSQKLKVATAISRAFKPECGFVLVDELEQMDWKTIQEFDAWAKAEGIQIIGAMVCDEDKGGENVIIIEDGRVKDA